MLPHSRELWTVDETAAYLKLKPKTIYDYVSARAIPVIRIGRSVKRHLDLTPGRHELLTPL